MDEKQRKSELQKKYFGNYYVSQMSKKIWEKSEKWNTKQNLFFQCRNDIIKFRKQVVNAILRREGDFISFKTVDVHDIIELWLHGNSDYRYDVNELFNTKLLIILDNTDIPNSQINNWVSRIIDNRTMNKLGTIIFSNTSFTRFDKDTRKSYRYVRTLEDLVCKELAETFIVYDQSDLVSKKRKKKKSDLY